MTPDVLSDRAVQNLDLGQTIQAMVMWPYWRCRDVIHLMMNQCGDIERIVCMPLGEVVRTARGAAVAMIVRGATTGVALERGTVMANELYSGRWCIWKIRIHIYLLENVMLFIGGT